MLTRRSFRLRRRFVEPAQCSAHLAERRGRRHRNQHGMAHCGQIDPLFKLRASHNCGTKCHVPSLEEGVETAETPGDGFRAGWLVAA